MGNIDTRSAFDHGYLMVQSDQPYYQPGELVTGKIFLRITSPIDATYLEIEVRGKEKASWIYYYWETIQNGDGTTR